MATDGARGLLARFLSGIKKELVTALGDIPGFLAFIKTFFLSDEAQKKMKKRLLTEVRDELMLDIAALPKKCQQKFRHWLHKAELAGEEDSLVWNLAKIDRRERKEWFLKWLAGESDAEFRQWMELLHDDKLRQLYVRLSRELGPAFLVVRASVSRKLKKIERWTLKELSEVRETILTLTVPPAFFLCGAAFAGTQGWGLKVLAVQFVWFFVIPMTILFAWRRLPLGVAVSVALSATAPESSGSLTEDVRTGGEDYIRFAAAVLASEIAAGHIVLWLPLHTDWAMASLLLPTVVLFVAWTVWRDVEARWWPRITYGLVVFTFIAAIGTILVRGYLPMATTAALHQLPHGSLDGWLASVFYDRPLLALAVVAALLVLVVVVVVVAMAGASQRGTKTPVAAGAATVRVGKGAASRAVLWGALIAVVWWIGWGGGDAALRQFLGIGARAAVPASVPGGIPGVHRIEVALRGPGVRTELSAGLIPACTRVSFSGATHVWLAGETKPRLLDGQHLGDGDLVAIKGDGKVAYLWLTDVGQQCEKKGRQSRRI